jgi:hypothetical protein
MGTTTAFTRLAVPEKATDANFEKAAYIRLGAYAGTLEDKLLTGLKTTSSTTSDEGKGAYDQSQDKIKNEKNKPADTWNATSQDAKKFKTNFTNHDPGKNGFLFYSDGDLHHNVKAAGLYKFGLGHTTEVSDRDATYKVPKGSYSLETKNGIFLKTTDSQANIELTAQGYIKQTAYGPLELMIYGTTRRQFIGNAFSFFLGDDWRCTIGMVTSLTMGLTTSCFIGISITLKLSLEFSLNAAATVAVKFFEENKLMMGNKLDIVIGAEFKQITGISTKLVFGQDIKMTSSDLKFVSGNDIKLVPTGWDAKKVLFDAKWFETEVKISGFKADQTKFDANQKLLAGHLTTAKTEAGQIETKSKTAILNL